jgi:hypothetical protein
MSSSIYLRISALLGLLGITAAPPDAIAQVTEAGTYELRCRGGEDLFRIQGPEATGSDTLQLYFNWAEGAARPDGGGLMPGTCSWIDRAWHEGEPSRIDFTTSGPLAAVTQPLQDSTKYWSFWVFNTSEGHFVARRNGPSKERPAPVGVQGRPPPQVASSSAAPAAEVTGRAGASDLIVSGKPHTEGVIEKRPPAAREVTFTLGRPKVTPMLHGVAIGFRGRRGASPTLEIGTEKPGIQVLGEPLRYRNPPLRLQPQQLSKGATPTSVEYLVAYSGLAQGAAYTYLITMPRAEGGPPAQVTGSFTTLGQTVRVVFTHIHVLSDSDDESSGDLVFLLHANPLEPGARERMIGAYTDPLQWESGTRHRLAAELVLENAPDRLRLVVQAEDDDHDLGDFRGVAPDIGSYEMAEPGANQSVEWGVAKGEFDLARHIGTATIPFTLRSVDPRNPNLTLAFDVGGYIEVIRP